MGWIDVYTTAWQSRKHGPLSETHWLSSKMAQSPGAVEYTDCISAEE